MAATAARGVILTPEFWLLSSFYATGRSRAS